MSGNARNIKSLVRIGLLRLDYQESTKDIIVRERKEILGRISQCRPLFTNDISNITATPMDNKYLSSVSYKGHIFLGIYDKSQKIIHFVDENNIPQEDIQMLDRTLFMIEQYSGNQRCQYPEGSSLFQAWKQTEPYLERAVEEMERFEGLRDSSVTAIGSDKFLEHDSILNHIALEYEAEMAIREYCKRNGITITSSYFDKNGAYYLNGDPFAYLQEDGRVKLFQAKTEWQRFFIKRELNFGFPAESVYYELRTLQALLPLFMEISPFTENEPTVIRLIESPLWKDPALAKEQFEKIQKFVQSSHTPVQEEELSQEIQNFFDKSL